MNDLKIGIDAMAGDLGTSEICQGVSDYLRESETKIIYMFGDLQLMQLEIDKQKLNPKLLDRLILIKTTEVIYSNEDPAMAIKRKKDSSLAVGVRYLQENKIDAFISSGSTGALLAAGIFISKRIPGISRPALGGLVPSTNKKEPTLFLDLGANIEAKVEHLVQYGQMGSIFMEENFSIDRPKVALLNIGVEENKGNTMYKEVYQELDKLNNINFVGNIEAKDVLKAEVDVIVMDGFAGNILLKSIEGTVSVFTSSLKQIFTKSIINKLAALIVKEDIRSFKKTLDYKELGCTPLFGVNDLILKAHGSSNAYAYKNALSQGFKMIENDFITKIKRLNENE